MFRSLELLTKKKSDTKEVKELGIGIRKSGGKMHATLEERIAKWLSKK